MVLKELGNWSSVSPYDRDLELRQNCNTQAMIGCLLCTFLPQDLQSFPVNPGREDQGVFIKSSSVAGKGGEAQIVNPIISRSFCAACQLPALKVWRYGTQGSEPGNGFRAPRGEAEGSTL